MILAIGYLLSSLLGLVAGAVLNALADDLPERRPVSRPTCAHCGQPRPLYDWVAAVAYLSGGRCRNCGAPIPLRRVLVELASALAVAYTWSRLGWGWQFAAQAVLVEILLLVTAIDVERRLILRVVMYPAALFALAIGVLDPNKGAERVLIGGAVGFGVTYLFYVFGQLFARAAGRLRGQELTEVAFGWGDVNFGLFIGLALGWPSVLFALLIAVFGGGLAGALFLAAMRLRGKGALFLAMPYGPFLALGALVMLWWGSEIAAWYLTR